MRGALDVDTLLKVILVLVVIWLALEVVGVFLSTLKAILGPLPEIIGLAIVVLIILYLLDEI